MCVGIKVQDLRHRSRCVRPATLSRHPRRRPDSLETGTCRVYKHDPDKPGRLQQVVCRRPRRSTSDLQRDRVLVAIKRADTDHAAPLQVGALNVRSLRNKSAAVLDMIAGNSLDLFAAVESWHDSAESPSVIASTPPGYRLFERARPRKASAASLASNHGGI